MPSVRKQVGRDRGCSIHRAVLEALESRQLFAATVGFTGSTYNQNFDGLISAGSATPAGASFDLSEASYSSAGTMDGWSAVATGTPRFSANNGGANTGSVYSYGNSGDRALGLLASGSNISRIGVTLVNNTAAAIESFTVTFDGEMWRRGSSAANTLSFGYKFGGAVADASGFTGVSQLNFTAPSTAGSGVAVDGNTAPFRTAGKTFTVTGVSWAQGDSLVLRWADVDDGGSDDGLGVDNFSFSVPTTGAPGTFNFDSANAVVNENAGTVTLGVTRSGGSSGAVNLPYSTANGTAIAGTNFTGASGSVLAFTDGQVAGSITVPILQDGVDALNKSFGVTFGTPSAGTIGATASTNVLIVDTDGHKLSTGALSQDWSNTGLIDTNGWNDVPNIVGFVTDADLDAYVPSIVANQLQTATAGTIGAVAELDGTGVTNPVVALQATTAVSAPQLLININTTGVTEASIAFNARDLDATNDDAIQPVTVSYRLGNSGAFTEFAAIADATTGPGLADLVTPLLAQLPAEAIGQTLVQIRIATAKVGGNNEWIGIDDIVIQQAVVGPVLPAWVGAGGVASWNAGIKTLSVTGATTITADPGSDLAVINATGAASQITINPTTDRRIHLAGLNLTGGASVTITSVGAGRSATNHRLLVVDATNFSIDTTSSLDLVNNDMVLKNATGATTSQIRLLIKSGFAGAAWTGPGIKSSAAAASGTTALGYVLNDGAAGFSFTKFGPGASAAEQENVGATDFLIKYTHAGDADLNGVVNFDDYFYIDSSYPLGSASSWAAGDFDYGGETNFDDYFYIDSNYPNSTQL